MSPRLYKAGLLLSAAALLVGVSRFQEALNRQRAEPELGLTRGVGLGSNAPPVLAFTTVALGGFRGLIANALWIRANELQQDGKYFEMVQLADWITKMEPTFTQVWTVQAWNMAYNISVKFPDPYDRWRWVQRGIEVLRDDGLRYNPKEALIYRELAWFYQHKIGQNLDDAHLIYKSELAHEMQRVHGAGRLVRLRLRPEQNRPCQRRLLKNARRRDGETDRRRARAPQFSPRMRLPALHEQPAPGSQPMDGDTEGEVPGRRAERRNGRSL